MNPRAILLYVAILLYIVSFFAPIPLAVPGLLVAIAMLVP